MSIETKEKIISKFTGAVPVFQIGDYQKAVDHYVNWLGFNLDWEWREASEKPVIMHISRDGIALFLNEFNDGIGPSMLNVNLTNLQSYADEVNARRPDSVQVALEQPYEIPAFEVTDPFGNTISFKQPILEQEQAARNARIPLMQKFIQEQIDTGKPYPTAEEVVAAVGSPIGLAIETLFEFSEASSKS
jgi:hypothetical protein